MTQDTKSPDVSYVTELQRRWIEVTYGEDWDKLQNRVIDLRQWTYVNASDPIPALELLNKISAIIDRVPDEYKGNAVFRASCDNYGDCCLTLEYKRIETEMDFNKRIASYLHRWEKIRDENLKEKTMFGLG